MWKCLLWHFLFEINIALNRHYPIQSERLSFVQTSLKGEDYCQNKSLKHAWLVKTIEIGYRNMCMYTKWHEYGEMERNHIIAGCPENILCIVKDV